MAKAFGLPILAAIALGLLFPYQALQLMPAGFAILFVLMVISALTVEWPRLKGAARRPRDLLFGLFLLYLFFPPLQWLLARALISDQQYLFGLLFCSLTPAAMVAPWFTSLVDGDEELSFLLMVASMAVCPLVAPLLIRLLAGPSIAFEMLSLIRLIALILVVPLLMGWLTYRFWPGLRRRILPHAGLLNAVCLSLLIYIFFGNAVGRLNLSYSSLGVVARLLLLAFVQDFGVLFLARFLLAGDDRRRNALAVTLSMKNVAVAAGILLAFDPKAALPPALAFVAHAFLFSFIPLARKRLAAAPAQIP